MSRYSEGDLSLVLDNKKTIFLILQDIISTKTITHHNSDFISISEIKSEKYETARLFLYLISIYCSGYKEFSLKDYLIYTNRSKNNLDRLYLAIDNLSSIKISYFDNNHRIITEEVFLFLVIRKEKVFFSFNSFLSKKLSLRGRGHSEVRIPTQILKKDMSLGYKENSLRFLVLLDLSLNRQKLKEREISWYINIVFKDSKGLRELKRYKLIYTLEKKYSFLLE